MKENDQLMKFKITDNKLQMEIGFEDLINLYNNDPNNWNGEIDEPYSKIIPEMSQDFVKTLVELFMDYNFSDTDNPRWVLPFKDSFVEIFENAEYFCEHSDSYYNL